MAFQDIWTFKNLMDMDIELITLVNSFRNTIALNNLLIKEKILRKLEMIHTMRWLGFPLMNFSESKNNKIIQELQRIDREGDIVKYLNATNNSDMNKILGDILHNAYQASGYNVILSNVPIHGNTIEGNYILLDSEAIYDTLSQYAKTDSVKSVFQIAADTYLIKIDSKVNALDICNLLNEKLLEGRIIKIEYIELLTNQIKLVSNKDNSKVIDDIDYDANSNENVVEDKSIKLSYFGWILDVFNDFIKRMWHSKNSKFM